MKNAIERAIAELELDYKIALARLDEPLSELGEGYWNAIKDKCGAIRDQLKAVLAEHEADNSRNASEPE